MKTVIASISFCTIVAVRAAAWTPVDVYQDMESGKPGDILTTQPQASGHGGVGTWNVVGNTMRVSTNHIVPLRGPISIGTTTYVGSNDTNSWQTDDNTQRQYVVYRSGSSYRTGTVGLYLTVGIHANNPSNSSLPILSTVDVSKGQIYDAVIMGSGPETNITTYAVCQIYDAAGGPYLEIEANPNNVTRHSAPIQIKADKPYWVTMKFDGLRGIASLEVYEPTNWSRIGAATLSQLKNTFSWISFGREDHHYNGPATHSYFDNILIDYTQAAFPLFPGNTSFLTPPVQLTLTPTAIKTDGTFQFTYTNRSGVSTTVFGSSNLATWSPIGIAAQISPGVFQFTDSNASNHPCRFYKVLSP
jgi:hypothetical protein